MEKKREFKEFGQKIRVVGRGTENQDTKTQSKIANYCTFTMAIIQSTE